MAKKESKQKKMNVRVDFTPMVDMLMLLITFFMLCTSLSKPQTMELTMPSNDENTQENQKNEAKASETVTLYVTADNKIYYGAGIPKYDDPTWIKETTWGSHGIPVVLVLRLSHQCEFGTHIQFVPDFFDVMETNARYRALQNNLPFVFGRGVNGEHSDLTFQGQNRLRHSLCHGDIIMECRNST